MSDFAQTGLISTFQHLNEAHDARIEHELNELARSRPITLILPCHSGDLHGPALAQIIRELTGATFLREIMVSLNDLDATGYAAAHDLFAPLKSKVRLLWNDGPRLREVWRAVFAETADAMENKTPGNPTRFPSGKGFNVWAAISVVCAERSSEIIVMQDCDVLSFRRSALARVCYPCASPELDYGFAKMYYSRVTDRLYGRVSRLFVTPLLRACIRVAGHSPLIDFLLSFRYPLAGECALTRNLAERLSMAPAWGFDIGLLCEAFRHSDPARICQVDGGSGYDHKHQPAGEPLAGMANGIAETLLGHLANEGVAFGDSFRGALHQAFRDQAELALRRSEHLAIMNGLPYDSVSEREMIECFAAQLNAGRRSIPVALPRWDACPVPDFADRLALAMGH